MKNIRLTIDLGSTSFKAAIFADNMLLLGEAEYKFAYLKNNDRVEIASDEVDNAIKLVVNKAVDSAGIAISDISAIGIASQAQTSTFINTDGTPVRPFISWLDNRAVKTCEQMRNDPIFNDFASHCSLERLYPAMQICLVHHLMNESDTDYANCQLVSLPSYLIYKLTGNNVTDSNLAAMGGLYSLQTKSWHQPYLNYCNLKMKQMPELIHIGMCAGQISGENFLDLMPKCKLFLCGNDQTAGSYGAQLNVDDILVNLGTAHVVYACRKELPEPEQNLFRGEYPGDLYYAMCAENGGAILTALLYAYPELESFDNLARLAEQSDSGSVSFSTDIKALNNFSWSDENSSLAAKAYAVFDYLANRIKIMIDMVSGGKEHSGQIYLTGGGRKNRILVKMIKEKSGAKIVELETSPHHGAVLMMNYD
ncbi:MAG: hypothetical protein L3J71_08185 [Victivallaceae bacterium]|nr:hypothetical protein [Victivallaceae bacterium]